MRAIQVYGYPEANTRLLEDASYPKGEALIAVEYSALNYKDMLAITGQGKIMRAYPLIAGIDVAGRIASSNSAKWREGDAVFVVGAGIGEALHGGLAEYTAVSENMLIRLPSAWTSKIAMLLGTAGFSAALAVDKLLKHGIVPEDGEIVVTGANGAVGLWALRLLSYLGYDVVAVAREVEKYEALFYQMGAQRMIVLDEFSQSKVLDKAQYAAVIDNLGGEALAAALAKTQAHGAVCAIGMAQSTQWQASIMPFILRGVTLYGMTSSNCRFAQREQIWAWLAKLWDSDFIAQIPYQEIFLDEVMSVCQRWKNRPAGRIIVNIGA